MQMILPTTLLFGALGYLIYTSKKELSLDYDAPLENSKEIDAVSYTHLTLPTT